LRRISNIIGQGGITMVLNSVGNLGIGIIAPQTRPTIKTTYNTENTGFKVRCLRWNYL